MDSGMIAAGFECPECGSSTEASILWMDNASQALSLRCMVCEALWHEQPLPKEGPDAGRKTIAH